MLRTGGGRRQFRFHGKVTDEDGAHIGAGFGNHQHSDHRKGVGPQDDRNVKTETQHDGQPHQPKSPVPLPAGRYEEQNYNQEPQQGKRNVAVNSPGKGRIGLEPPVLRHQAQRNPNRGQNEDGDGERPVPPNPVAQAPHKVEQHIKNRHGDGGDPFAQPQKNGIIFQSASAQSQHARNQMKRIARTQHHGHDTEQAKLPVAPALPDHHSPDGDDKNQIDGIKQ